MTPLRGAKGKSTRRTRSDRYADGTKSRDLALLTRAIASHRATPRRAEPRAIEDGHEHCIASATSDCGLSWQRLVDSRASTECARAISRDERNRTP